LLQSQSLWVKIFGIGAAALFLALIIVLILRTNPKQSVNDATSWYLRWVQTETAAVKYLVSGVLVLLLVFGMLVLFQTPNTPGQSKKPAAATKPEHSNELEPVKKPTPSAPSGPAGIHVEQNTSGDGSPAVNVGEGNVTITNQQGQEQKQPQP